MTRHRKKVSHSKKGPGRAKGKKITKTRRVLNYIIKYKVADRKAIQNRFRKYNRSTLNSIIYRLEKRKYVRRTRYSGAVRTSVKAVYSPIKKYILKRYKTIDLIPTVWYEHFLSADTESKKKVGKRRVKIKMYALTYAPFSSRTKDLSFWLLRAIRQVTGFSPNDYAYQGTKKKHGDPEWEDIEVGAIEGTRYRVIDTV